MAMLVREGEAARSHPLEPVVPGGVRVRHLVKTYPGPVEALRDVSFDVQPGEVFRLLGPNGAGKSTAVGVLTTTVRPTGGRVLVGGYDVTTQPLEARRVSSVVFQDPAVDRGLSGRRNLEIHARLWRVPAALRALRIDSTAGALGLDGILDRPVSSYSGGQRRRLEIARALVSEPAVLFLDEPTVGLDPRIRHELLDAVAGLRDRASMTILLTTHYLDEAEALCDRLAIMHLGRIVALDTPSALRASLGDQVLEVRSNGDPSAALRALRSEGLAGDDAFVVGSTFLVPVHGRGPSEARAAIDALGHGAIAVVTRPPTLDDVYLRLTGDRLAVAA